MKVNVPSWLKDAVFYQIYPQSFRDSSGDGIGDIQGIIEKLDYVKNLGCNAIWLNPLFTSPFYDAGYDVENYYCVAPRYGTNKDLMMLFKEVHKRDMHILLDLVPGHTAMTHKWFKESMKAEKNEFSDRYIWTSSVWESPEGLSHISGFGGRDGSCVVNFFSHQPALNYGFYNRDKEWQQSPDDEAPTKTRKELINIMKFWLEMGCDGFRVDMAGSLVKNDPEQFGNVMLWREVRDFLDREFPNAVLVSEWGEPDKSLAGGFQMAFLLQFGSSHYTDLFRAAEPFFSSRGKGDISEFVKTYEKNFKAFGNHGVMCIPSGNHDIKRISYTVDELRLAFAFILSMPGVPFIYYGDEIGMRYLEGAASVEGGYDRTGSRSPMQWDDSKNAGFSNGEKLYINLDESENRPNVKSQIEDENSLYNEVKKLIKIRRENPALDAFSGIEFINAKYPLIYKRSCEKQSIVIIINPSKKEFKVKDFGGKVIYKFGGYENNIIKGQSAVFLESSK